MADIGHQIKKLRTLRGMKQIELAEKIGVSNKRLSNWERGLAKPGQDMIDKICKVFNVDYFDLVDMNFETGVTFDYIRTHRELDENFPKYYINQAFLERFNALDESGKRLIMTVLEHEEERMEQLKRFKSKSLTHPVYILPASAGSGEFLDSDDYELMDFPEEAVPRSSNFAIRVSGDSMEPVYPDGSIVFVKKTKEIFPGEVGIFICNGEGFIKILGENHNLISYNKKYSDIQIHNYDDLRLVGKVVGVYSED